MTRNLTSACTRPATRRMSYTINRAGGRVMRGVRWLTVQMRHLIFILIALVSGYCLTLVFYMVGGALVLPALLLARMFAADRGGDSLLMPFTVINTAICAVLIYAALWWAAGRVRVSK